MTNRTSTKYANEHDIYSSPHFHKNVLRAECHFRLMVTVLVDITIETARLARTSCPTFRSGTGEALEIGPFTSTDKLRNLISKPCMRVRRSTRKMYKRGVQQLPSLGGRPFNESLEHRTRRQSSGQQTALGN